ncbi:MAG: hypothetical protein E4H36_03985 [Spirochaetales bacterium]|nr:MAG: hypothetical protein E4H36_03985 [Spirochaetales bacterium]
MSLLVNPRDEVGFRRIINKPARGLGNAALAKIMSRRVETGLDFIEALARAIPSLSGSAKKGASVFSDAFSHCAEFMKEAPVFSLVEEVISSFGLKQFYMEEDAVSGTARMKNLEEVVTAASDYGKGLEGLLQFLEDLELDRSRIEGQEEGTEDRVTLITLHNTKGLEFDRVIITGMEEGLFPSLRGSENDEDDLEEERRLFYVGITRAREELYLTTCGMRQIWGRTMPAAPSRFLSEFPKNLVTEKATYSRTEEGGFPPGMEVDHPEYGRGLVAGQRVSGSQVIITVAFEDGRVCQFIPKYSSLRPVG